MAPLKKDAALKKDAEDRKKASPKDKKDKKSEEKKKEPTAAATEPEAEPMIATPPRDGSYAEIAGRNVAAPVFQPAADTNTNTPTQGKGGKSFKKRKAGDQGEALTNKVRDIISVINVIQALNLPLPRTKSRRS